MSDSERRIYLGPVVQRMIIDHLADLKPSARTLRIFVVHHHLLPFAEPPWGNQVDTTKVLDRADPTMLIDSARLQTWLADHSFHVVLHGHKHIGHGRRDVLWRKRQSPDGRTLFVVGAGSAGVFAKELGHGEPLTYNVIHARRLAPSWWDASVNVRSIDESTGIHEAVDWFAYRAQIGVPPRAGPAVFGAERMKECHELIADAARENRRFVNFVSVVEDYRYEYPPTIRIGEQTPSPDEVMESFLALHPEYSEKDGWEDLEHVDRELRALSPRFQFQHGPRLFGVLGRAGTQLRGVDDRDGLRPVVHAVDTLAHSDTRAYVGLYNPEIDIATEREPLPGLLSVQFVPDGSEGGFLDAVVTFRKLELSFWWVVNMLEAGRLLEWAADRDTKHRKPRRITFFAPVAEWKDNPEATFVTELDRMGLDEIVELVNKADSGNAEAKENIVRLVRDKIARTNEVNIDPRGLQLLAQAATGVARARGSPRGGARPVITRNFGTALSRAVRAMVQAVEKGGETRRHLKTASEQLETAVRLLGEGT